MGYGVMGCVTVRGATVWSPTVWGPTVRSPTVWGPTVGYTMWGIMRGTMWHTMRSIMWCVMRSVMWGIMWGVMWGVVVRSTMRGPWSPVWRIRSFVCFGTRFLHLYIARKLFEGYLACDAIDDKDAFFLVGFLRAFKQCLGDSRTI